MALVFGLSLRSGGYPPAMPATAAAVLLFLLSARLLLAPETVRGFSGPALVASAGLFALLLLSLASAAWSGAPARAVTAASRDLLYLSVFATMATLPIPALGPAARGLLAAIAAVVAIALATKLLPGLFPLSADEMSQRLAFPLSYQNALGLLAGTGLLVALHLTSERGEPRASRIAAAACVPALVAALYLTQSRGAIGATFAGLLVWLAVGRSRWMLAGLAAIALPALAALAGTYAAVELVSASPGPAVVSQGRAVTAGLLVCTLAAAWLRIQADRHSDRIAALELRRIPAQTAALAAAAVALLACVAGGVALAERAGGADVTTADPRVRLVQTTSSGRVDLWRGAGRMFEAAPVLGGGADTFQTGWERVRGNLADATEAHSLYFETLAELGIAGLLLVVVTLAGLIACGFGASGARTGRAIVVAVAAAWVVHAAVDWDWEMPAATVGLLVLAGAARAGLSSVELSLNRSTLLAGVLIVAACFPAVWAVSQGRSDHALAAYAAGDCRSAIRSADGALALTPFRPEAHFTRAACLARAHRGSEALAAASEGVRWDRDDFRGAYDDAAVRTAIDGSGFAEAQRANRLNRLAPYSNWLPYWLDPRRRQSPELIAGLTPLLLGGEHYPPIRPPYARPSR